MRKEARVVAVMGLPICNVGMKEAVASINGRIRSGACYQIATANLDFVNNARRNPELHRIICDCNMVLPDGFPLIWASRLLGRPLKQRVTGVDLTPELAKLSAEKGYGIFLLGSTDANAQAAMAVLTEKYPKVRFVGQYAPPTAKLEDMDNTEIFRRVHEAKPDILLVAFGNPKQELWIHRHREQLKVPVSIGIGGTLEMIAGSKIRAPRVLQALHLEWVFRLLQEPARLLPRYTQDFLSLLRYLPRDLVVARLQPGQKKQDAVDIDRDLLVRYTDSSPVVFLKGSLTGPVCGRLRDVITELLPLAQDITVDLSGVNRVEADGVGCLLDMRRALGRDGRTLHLVGASEPIKRVLKAASVDTILKRTRTSSIRAAYAAGADSGRASGYRRKASRSASRSLTAGVSASAAERPV